MCFTSDIDFVITWVDGNDSSWKKQKDKFSNGLINETNSDIRFRDWGLLRYWFRSVEKHAPWVRKIHFVTYGHVPEWLDINNPKINIVKHEDFIPIEYLPTFSANVIEIFMHRIPDLSEKFVFFNDDVFLTNDFASEDFFVGNVVKDSLVYNAVSSKNENSIIEHIVLNDLEIISKYFDKKSVQKKLFSKIINIKYGKSVIKSFLLWPWKSFTGIENPHGPSPLLKSVYDDIWNLEKDNLLLCANNKFRDKNDYNQYLFRYWNMMSGNFIPTKNYNKYIDLKNDNSEFINNFLNDKYKSICINDSDINIDFDSVKKALINAFDKKYSIKSEFEK